MRVKKLLLIYQITLKTSQKLRNLHFCHEKIKTVTNAFEMGNFDHIGITGNYSSAQRGKTTQSDLFYDYN